jgi:hypothetical protein
MFLYAAVFSVAIALCLYAVVRYLRADRLPVTVAFAVVMAAVASWELLNFLVDAATTQQLKLLGKNAVNAAVYPVFVYGNLAFALVYTDNERWVRPVAVVCVVQIVGMSAALGLAPELLYESNGLVTQGPFTVAGITVDRFVALDRTLKPTFLILWAHAQLVMLATGAILVRYIDQTSRIFVPGQVAAVLVGVAAPLSASFLLVSGVISPVWNPTDISFVVTVIVFGFVVFRYRLFRLTPMTSQQLVGIEDDPAVLLDRDDWVIGSNTAARVLFGAESDRREAAAETFFGPFAEQVTRSHGTNAADATLPIKPDDDRRFELATAPVRASADTIGGRLVVFRDVTDRAEDTQAIQRQNERLEELADVVADDLRNG